MQSTKGDSLPSLSTFNEDFSFSDEQKELECIFWNILAKQ